MAEPDQRTVSRLLVANRGEIARRIIATCQAMGVQTVAVYSDADEQAPHVAEADLAVRLPGNAPAETYLRADLIVEAARRAGADAVHPGYGFLAENAGFARAVLDAGLVWVGPPPDAIAAMGSKLRAKELMRAAGVPVLPACAPDEVRDFPVLVKADLGGGGRGMRVVTDPAGLAGAVEAAGREAASAFGDGTVFCEPWLGAARHVEVQVLADAHGRMLALGERECSVQRRHQKVVEETPAPDLPARLRTRLADAALAAARAIGYVGAGTVEFLLAGGRFHVLEVNTRLQVEHPVTECVWGLDLVRLQLRIAEGAALPEPSELPEPRGHAIEARLYAEDPTAGWAPSSGMLSTVDVPADARFAVPARFGVRLDSAVESGGAVPPYYDPLLAKVIAWAPTRAEAARMLAGTLARSRLHGLPTNRDLLVRVLRHPEFLAGRADTGFLARHPGCAEPLLDAEGRRLCALAAALARAAWRRERSGSTLPPGWRNNPSQPQHAAFDGVDVEYRFDRNGGLAWPEGVRLLRAEPGLVELETGGLRHALRVARSGDMSYVDSTLGSAALREVDPLPEPADRPAEGSLLAPLPGSVVHVAVEVGQRVAAGQLLLTLEAMKMEHPVCAPGAGTVADLPAAPGMQVEAGALLATIDRDAPEE